MEKRSEARATHRVVLVDDIPDIRRVVQEIITLLSYPVLVTTDIHTAAAIWAANPRSILVADGTLLTSQLDSLRPLLEPHANRMLVISGYQPRDLPGLAAIPGCTFLHKPFTIHELDGALQGIAAPTEQAAGEQ